jgi:hypothetical protein
MTAHACSRRSRARHWRLQTPVPHRQKDHRELELLTGVLAAPYCRLATQQTSWPLHAQCGRRRRHARRAANRGKPCRVENLAFCGHNRAAVQSHPGPAGARCAAMSKPGHSTPARGPGRCPPRLSTWQDRSSVPKGTTAIPATASIHNTALCMDTAAGRCIGRRAGSFSTQRPQRLKIPYFAMQ